MTRQTCTFTDNLGQKIPGKRWRNPDGSLGGWVANTAEIAPSAIIEPGAMVCPGVSIGEGFVVKAGAIVG